MPIHCVGLNYKTADIDIREYLAFSEDHIRQFIEQYASKEPQANWEEIAILSTCNRIEFYAVAKDAQALNLQQQIAEFCQVSADTLDPVLYKFIDEQAVAHLFRVASGLDSMVIGEPQILGQVTQAYEFSLSRNASGKIISRLFQAAIHTGKRVRSETAIGERSVSVSSMAAKLISQKIKDLSAVKVVLIGAGEMAELAVEALRKRGVQIIHIVNRTIANACALAARWQGEASTLDSLPAVLQDAEVLISSTSAPHTVVETELIEDVMSTRKSRSPLIIIDIAIPRDVNPNVGVLPDVHLYDIDYLNDEAQHSFVARQREIPLAEEIIFQELDLFLEYLAAEKIIPLIIKMRHKADKIRQIELEKALKRMPDLDMEAQAQLEWLTESIVNKILHAPTKRLRAESSGPDISNYAHIASSLFGLDDFQE